VVKIQAPTLAGSISVLGLGVLLVVDGARKIMGTDLFKDVLSYIRDGVIHLKNIMCKELFNDDQAFKLYIKELSARPQGFLDTLFTGGAVVGATSAGAAIGAGIAAPAAATVLGSQTLGAWAISAGLIAAPVAPILPLFLCGAAGAAVGYAGWKAIKLTLNEDLLNEITESLDNDIIVHKYIEKLEEEYLGKLQEQRDKLKENGEDVLEKIKELNARLEVLKYNLANDFEILITCSDTNDSFEHVVEKMKHEVCKISGELTILRKIRDADGLSVKVNQPCFW
jgi:uncharacterized membrane protein YphA (DoxX/SURF4 family)